MRDPVSYRTSQFAYSVVPLTYRGYREALRKRAISQKLDAPISFTPLHLRRKQGSARTSCFANPPPPFRAAGVRERDLAYARLSPRGGTPLRETPIRTNHLPTTEERVSR